MFTEYKSPPLESFTAINWRGKKLLLIEPNETNAILVKELLCDTGIQIICTINGKLAIAEFKQNFDIDVVLMELRLPDINGFEIFKILKNIKPQIPIIPNTATVQPEVRKKCSDAGFFGFIAKPAYIDDYLKIINKALLLY